MSIPRIIDSPCEVVRATLRYIGEDPTREGLIDTPSRVVRSWNELFSGYSKDPKSVFKTFEDGACDELVLLKGIEFYSQCEHHMLPFFGKANIAYIPNGKIIGISKLARLLEIYSRRLQVQERLTTQITKALDENLSPLGSACILQATHLCMCMRGVQKQNSVMVTSSLTGVFKEEASARSELLRLIGL
jgi:GTP cyclohydrolase I